MATNLLQKRTFVATLPAFLATPPVAAELGQIVLSANAAQRAMYIAVADDATATNSEWYQIDDHAASRNVSVNIPAGAGTTVEDDINDYDFSLAGVTVPKDSTATSEGLVESGINMYFVCARTGETFLYGGVVPAAIGNENTPWDGSSPGAPAPTDAPHETIQAADLIPFGGNPDAMLQTPAAGTSQSITSADPADTPMTLVPAAAQTAPLLEVGPDTVFDAAGYLSMVQDNIADGIMMTFEQFLGAGSIFSAHESSVPGTPLFTLDILEDPLGDLVNRAVLSGDATDYMVIENAILDGGVFV